MDLRNIFASKSFTAWAVCSLAFLCAVLGSCQKRTTVEPKVVPAEARDLNIRVLLKNNADSAKLSTAGGFDVACTDGTSAHFTPGEVDIVPWNGMIRLGRHSFAGDVDLQVKDTFVTIDGRKYRGDVRIIIDARGGLDVINELDVENYLAGVVGEEMPAYWEPEALKAQAVAARTYCLYIKHRFGTDRQWDVKATEANQMYGGLESESAMVRTALDATAGQVLTCDNGDGPGGIFPTYYSSTCGGHTEDSKNVFGDSYKPLSGVDCQYCKKTAGEKYMNWKPVVLPSSVVTAKITSGYSSLEGLTTVDKIVPTRVSDYGSTGRIAMLKVVDNKGKTGILRGEDLRLTLDPSGKVLKSTWCNISKQPDGSFKFSNGRGFGHGVGMCQYGALGMAREGFGYKEVLSYYYPNSDLVKIY
ncbi:SpoIID/LytB domain-containing protein [Anaerohalosphaera lusitana]|uniref:SpoIID/LytB domain-containing protein n=1 Tax=Anaerohalosphaera lusitana TaxID=1936003 RepID=UPI0011BAD0D1|nr:SpoIID/LytB domain-containing protein [Anaerohalosphaera lusitana]